MESVTRNDLVDPTTGKPYTKIVHLVRDCEGNKCICYGFK